MADNESEVGAITQSVAKIVTEVPVYRDALQPLAIQVGKAGQTVGEALNLALAPLRGVVWCADEIREMLVPAIAQRLSEAKAKLIQRPHQRIVGPAVDALRCSGGDPFLREMYAKLLATSMDLKTAELAHPAYVELIKQLSPADARLLEAFRKRKSYPVIWFRIATCSEQYSHIAENAGIADRTLFALSMDNLTRLGLLSFTVGSGKSLAMCKRLAEEPAAKARRAEIAACRGEKVTIRNGKCSCDRLASRFITACLPS